MKSNFVALGNFIEEIRQRIGTEKKTVYSVTNDRGFISSLEVFNKQVFSTDISSYKLVERNDLAYNPSRINVGSVAICPDENGGAVSPMYTIVRCKKELLPQYLLYFLKSEKGVSEINHRAEGAVRFQLKFKDLQRTPIYLPPLPEQERIVRLLGEAEALRAACARANARMEQFVPALFQEMFGDPATNPKKWEIIKVRSLLKLCEYGTSQKANEEGNGLPVLRMGNVTFEGDLDLTNLKHVELSDNEAKKQLLESGDVLFNRTNSRELVGKTGMWDGRFPAFAASYFIRVRFDSEKEHPQHFTTFMNLPYMKRKLADMARGAVGQANINAQELQSIEVPVPPLALQREFAARVGEVRGVQSAQVKSAERVEALVQSMLSRAFAGEL